MRKSTGGCAAVVVAVVVGATPAQALAPVTISTHDTAPFGTTRPTLVGATQVVRLHESARVPRTPVRFKVYPDTYGYRAVNGSCQGKFFTPYVKTTSTGGVTITLDPARRLCRGVVYQAEALIGHGDVPDKWAHMCVRGRETPTAAACQDSQ